LHNINWFRIVIDEADKIKNKDTTVTKAVIDLNSIMKWVLTGTPVQNKIGDI
jgi:SNF2 family DNA or RNA helicase